MPAYKPTVVQTVQRSSQPMSALDRNNAMLYGSASKAAPAKQPTVAATVPRATPIASPKVAGNYSASFQNAYNQLNPTPTRPTPTYSPPKSTYVAPKPAPAPAPTPAPAPAPAPEEEDPMYWFNLVKSYGYKKGGSVKVTSRLKSTPAKAKKNSSW